MLVLHLAMELHAQAPTGITESSYAARLGNNWEPGPDKIFAATFGLIAPISPRVGIGAVGQVGVSGDLYSAVGPRLRIHANRDLAVDLTPLVRLSSGGSRTGRAWLDAGLIYRDQVGLGLTFHLVDQAFFVQRPPWHEVRKGQPIVTAGVRLGSRPGRVGMVAMVVAGVAGAIAFMAGGGW